MPASTPSRSSEWKLKPHGLSTASRSSSSYMTRIGAGGGCGAFGEDARAATARRAAPRSRAPSRGGGGGASGKDEGDVKARRATPLSLAPPRAEKTRRVRGCRARGGTPDPHAGAAALAARISVSAVVFWRDGKILFSHHKNARVERDGSLPLPLRRYELLRAPQHRAHVLVQRAGRTGGRTRVEIEPRRLKVRETCACVDDQLASVFFPRD